VQNKGKRTYYSPNSRRVNFETFWGLEDDLWTSEGLDQMIYMCNVEDMGGDWNNHHQE
jgi:hypothetical protein